MLGVANRADARLGRKLIAATFALSIAAHAEACEMSVSGSMLTISGEIRQGDEFRFRDFLKELGTVRVVSLNSGGGDIISAGEIGRQVRAAQLTTVVDAARQVCASSCTIIFAGGLRRIYLHAERVGGLARHAGFKGLGFHQGSEPGMFGHMVYSGSGTSAMIALYNELGVPNAAHLVDSSSPETIYGLSASRALALGIATNN
jgi:hypothetical protein